MFELLKMLKLEYYSKLYDASIKGGEERLKIENSLTNTIFLGMAVVLPIAIYINILTGINESVFNFFKFALLTVSLLLTLENLTLLYMDTKNSNLTANIDTLVVQLLQKYKLLFSLLIIAPFVAIDISIAECISYIFIVFISYLSLKFAPQRMINIDIKQIIALIIATPFILYFIEIVIGYNISFAIYAYVTTYVFYFFTILIYIYILLLIQRIPSAIDFASINLSIDNDNIVVRDLKYTNEEENGF